MNRMGFQWLPTVHCSIQMGMPMFQPCSPPTPESLSITSIETLWHSKGFFALLLEVAEGSLALCCHYPEHKGFAY